MMNALRIAATGMQAQQENVDVLSNNIANISTTGYKAQRVGFTDLMYQNEIAVGAITSDTGTMAPTGAQVGMGVSVGSIYRILTNGNVEQTGNTYDMAINGSGYFQVQLPDGTIAYTRDGSFTTDQNGQIVTKDGYALIPNITIPQGASDIQISSTGVVSAKLNGSSTTTQLGQMTVTNFINPGGLEAIGNNQFLETDTSGTPIQNTPGQSGSGTILQTYLEGSNVDPIQEVTRLITAQRSYELNSRVITTADQMLSAVNQIQ